MVPNLTGNLEKGMKTIIEISEKVNERQTYHQVILSADDSNDFVSRPRFGLMEVVYEWARGMSFKNITDLTDVLEGTIVRVITRLDETCREVKNAARIIGDPELFAKMPDLSGDDQERYYCCCEFVYVNSKDDDVGIMWIFNGKTSLQPYLGRERVVSCLT